MPLRRVNASYPTIIHLTAGTFSQAQPWEYERMVAGSLKSSDLDKARARNVQLRLSTVSELASASKRMYCLR